MNYKKSQNNMFRAFFLHLMEWIILSLKILEQVPQLLFAKKPPNFYKQFLNLLLHYRLFWFCAIAWCSSYNRSDPSP